MKINLGKLVRVAAQIAVAVPTVVAAVKPIIAATGKASDAS